MPLLNGLQKIAVAGLIWEEQQKEQLELERQRQEQARLENERNSPKALAERDRAMLLASADQAIAKQQAIERANAEAQAAQKAARDAELMLISNQLAQRLIPAITAAITAGFAQLKDNLQKEI